MKKLAAILALAGAAFAQHSTDPAAPAAKTAEQAHQNVSARQGTPAGAGAPTVDQILEKYVTAVAGADAMRKVTSRAMKGTQIAGGNQTPIEVLTKAPNKRVTIVHTQNGDSFTAFDGKAGWMGNTGRPAREMSGAESAAYAIDGAFYLPLQIKELYPQLRRSRPET